MEVSLDELRITLDCMIYCEYETQNMMGKLIENEFIQCYLVLRQT